MTLETARRNAALRYEKRRRIKERYKEARKRLPALREILNSAWEESRKANAAFLAADDELRQKFAQRDKLRDYYRLTCAENNPKIAQCISAADAEHKSLKQYAEKACRAFEAGDKKAATEYAREKYAHQKKRDALNAKIKLLVAEVQAAKVSYHEAWVDKTPCQKAKAAWNDARNYHISIKAEYVGLKELIRELEQQLKQLT